MCESEAYLVCMLNSSSDLGSVARKPAKKAEFSGKNFD